MQLYPKTQPSEPTYEEFDAFIGHGASKLLVLARLRPVIKSALLTMCCHDSNHHWMTSNLMRSARNFEVQSTCSSSWITVRIQVATMPVTDLAVDIASLFDPSFANTGSSPPVRRVRRDLTSVRSRVLLAPWKLRNQAATCACVRRSLHTPISRLCDVDSVHAHRPALPWGVCSDLRCCPHKSRIVFTSLQGRKD